MARWPTRFQRALEKTEDNESGATLEARERKKVVDRLGGFLAVTGLWNPGSSDAERAGEDLARQRFAMGRRLGTLRQHVRNAEKVSRFCVASYGRRWLQDRKDFFDLVATRLSEPCGKHVPRALLTSIGFMEQASEVPE